MWPFKKKSEPIEVGENKVDLEEMKKKIEAQLVFDPVTKTMKFRTPASAPKEAAPDDPKPITPGEKLECPFCKQFIDKYSRRGKCPLCKNWVYYFNGLLYSKEESERVKDEFYRKRYQARASADAFSEFGISDEMVEKRESELTGSSGRKPTKAAVFMSLFNEGILKEKDLREQERKYMEAARVLDRMGEDSFHLQKAAALSRLAALKTEKFSKVYILATGNCDKCKALDGKVMTIEEAKKTLPIPIREGCNNKGEGDKYSICVCSYEGEADEEYLNRVI